MDKVNQLNVKKDMKVSELIEQFNQSGVLGSGRVARASNILCDMINDEEMNVFMSLGGPLIPGGLRNIVTDMIKQGIRNPGELLIHCGYLRSSLLVKPPMEICTIDFERDSLLFFPCLFT